MNFGQIKTKVAAYANRDDLTSIIPDWIVSAQLNLERKYNFKGMESYATGSIAIMTLALPTSYKEMLTFTIKDAGVVYDPLIHKSVAEAFLEYPLPDDKEGRPVIFAEDNAQSVFVLRPTPDKSYTYEQHYYKHLTVLSNDSDTNWWTDKAYELLLYGALIEGKAYVGDNSDFGTWVSIYNTILNDLISSEMHGKWAGSRVKAKPAIVI